MTIVWPQPLDSVKHASIHRFQGRLCRLPRRSLCNRPIGLCRQRKGPCEQGRRTVFPRHRSMSPVITDYASERAGSVTQAPGLKCYPRNRLYMIRKAFSLIRKHVFEIRKALPGLHIRVSPLRTRIFQQLRAFPLIRGRFIRSPSRDPHRTSHTGQRSPPSPRNADKQQSS